MITDSLGNPVGYLPVALVEGQESAPLILLVTPELPAQRLRATSDPDATLLGSIDGGAYVDLSAAPIDLSPYYGGTVSVEIKVAAGSVSGLRRVSLFLGMSSGRAAQI